MILYAIVRNISRIASVQLKTAQQAKLSKRMLAPGSHAFNIFKQIVELPELKFLNTVFVSNGFELRMAGGAVRDILTGIHPNDVDLASNATPSQMISFMKDKENIRLITTPSGERHGTVTARINDKHQFEITTLRIDKTTDGRHAEVIFTNDWKIDASRRDLTINSMFLDLNGNLYDYFNGETDLKNKVICFVGEPEARIREDYLRIFRYFRFHARFGCAAKHDSFTLNTIKDNIVGLEQISGERIWAEMKRILTIRDCLDVISVMFNDIRIGKYLGFKSESYKSSDDCCCDLTEFTEVLSKLKSGVDLGVMTSWEPSTLFASLIKDSDELFTVVKRLKLSNIERDSIHYIITNRKTLVNCTTSDLRKQLALSPKPNQNNLKKSIIECMKYCGLFSQIESISNWKIPDFPFTGHLIAGRVNKRSLIKDIIDEMKLFWAESDFQSTEQDLKIQLEEILQKEKYKSQTNN